jgi:RHS repeat-associated protein
MRNHGQIEGKKPVVARDAGWSCDLATPDVDIDYDRLGRKTRESKGTTTSEFQYSPTTLLPTLETIRYDLNGDGTPELTRQLERGHDTLLRPTGFTLKDGATLGNQAAYGYDASSRLSQISNPQISNTPFTYTYVDNSALLHTVAGPVHTVTNTWETDRDVLLSKENKAGGTVVSRFDYSVNATGQRTATSQTGSAFASVRSIAWGYDTLGQLTSAATSDHSADRAYQYDAIGNRKKSANALTLPADDTYTANALNQYSSITGPQSAILNPAYDLDGNATAYPLPANPAANSVCTWDAENRLTSATVNGVTITYQYDANSRRIAKTSAATQQSTVYLYDGWNIVAEYVGSAGLQPALSKTDLWGLDLSWTLQGAGGVGGLLAVHIHNPQSSIYYPSYDGNGNISEYLAATGAVNAHFEYDPFGNTTVNTDTTGRLAHRFSTKPVDSETGLYYYGYRYYDPLTGRWPSRDPIAERGGVNLYGFVYNNPFGWYDYLGRDPFTVTAPGLTDAMESVGHDVAAAHYERNANNKQVPRTDQTRLPDSMSTYHQQGTCNCKSNKSNTKHVSADGHDETVYDCNGNIVTDPVNRGTYNYASPNGASGIVHFFVDVLPYYILGNSPDDPTHWWQRIGGTYDGDTGRYYPSTGSNNDAQNTESSQN